MPKATGTLYPMTQIPPGKEKLDVFVWFDYIRPVDKNDVFNWRGKAKGTEIKVVERHAPPLQQLSGSAAGRKEERPAATAEASLSEKSPARPTSGKHSRAVPVKR